MCGIGQDLVETTYCLKPSQYPASFVESRPDGINAISFTFYSLSSPSARGFSFFEGFARWYAISDLSLITYQKPPPFLEKASHFASSWQCTLPWADGLRAWPRVLVAPRWSQIETVYEDISDKLDLHKTLKLGIIFKSSWKLRVCSRIQFGSVLLIVIGAIDPKNSLIVTFYMSNIKKRLPHHMAFQIKSTYWKTNIFWTVIDEGASTCVMFIACWKDIRSSQVVPPPTLLIAFDGHSHRLHRIIPAFPVFVGGKVVNIEVEIVDANYYNILLGWNWIYEMDAIVSSLFRIICFPHEGRIVTVDQMEYSLKESNASSDSFVPLVNNPKQPVENLGVGMYSSLIGTIDLPSPIAWINSISSSKAPSRRVFLKTHYFSDPWPLPSYTTTLEVGKVGGKEYPMSTTKISYQFIVNTGDFDPTLFHRKIWMEMWLWLGLLNLLLLWTTLILFYHLRKQS